MILSRQLTAGLTQLKRVVKNCEPGNVLRLVEFLCATHQHMYPDAFLEVIFIIRIEDNFRAKRANLISDAKFSQVISLLINEKPAHRQMFEEIRDGQMMSDAALSGTDDKLPCWEEKDDDQKETFKSKRWDTVTPELRRRLSSVPKSQSLQSPTTTGTHCLGAS